MIIRWWWSGHIVLYIYCGDIIVPSVAVDSHQRGQVDCISEWDLSCKEKARKGSGLANATTGSLPFKEESSWQHKNMRTYTDKKTDTHNPAWISYIYSTSHKWMALMFWAFRQSQSALLCVCGVTRSLEMALAPSSQGRNHLVEWQTHTHIHTRTQHREAGWIWIALRQTFLTQVLYSSTRSLLCPEHTPTHIQRYLHRDSILSAFSPRSCNNKRCCPAVKHCQ